MTKRTRGWFENGLELNKMKYQTRAPEYEILTKLNKNDVRRTKMTKLNKNDVRRTKMMKLNKKCSTKNDAVLSAI